uniref:Uncharacterized protein n=1 Tax=Schistosoma mansoni TaxID=6183 RepID=A0A5K4FFK8_SCHMA
MNIHSRDILISEIKVSLDRTQSELAQVKSSEAKLREDIEESLHETVKREQKLLEKHNAIIEVLRKTETEERIKLQNNINRLQSELEKERLHAAVELQTAIDDAVKEKERLRADTAQKIFDLELRIHLANESVELANKTKHDYMQELSCKEEEICNLNCKLNELNKIVESQRLKIRDLHTRLNESKLKQDLLESTKVQNEELATSQKAELTEEIDKLKLKLQQYEEELMSMNMRHEEQVNSLQIQNKKLTESLNEEKQKTKHTTYLLKEEKIKYHNIQSIYHISQNHIKQLNEDLKHALIKPNIHLNDIQFNHNHNNNDQLNYLINNYNQLKNENIKLKQIINIMSKQAKQFIQLSSINNNNDNQFNKINNDNQFNKINNDNDDNPFNKINNDDDNQFNKINNGNDNQLNKINNNQLIKAIKQIYQLTIDKQLLIELSNRLQFKLDQLIKNQYNNDNNNNHNLIMKESLNNNIESNNEINNDVNKTSLDNNHNNDHDPDHHHQHHYNIIDKDDMESIITGKGSISNIFKLLDEVASLGSENDIENLHGNRLTIQGKHISNPKLKMIK